MKRKEIVTVSLSGESIEMTLGKLMVNLLVMRIYADTGVMPVKEDLFMEDSMKQETLEKYFNKIVRKFRNLEEPLDYDILRKEIAETENEMTDMSSENNPKVGNSISYRDFIKLECEDPEAYELFHPTVKPGAYSDIEAQFKREGDREFKYFEEHKEAELHPFVAAETGVNKKQLTQMIGFVGLKPDMDGSVIPVVISDNFLKGLAGLESYFINCKGTRKALTTNQKQTRKSGYLTRKLSLSNIDHYHDNNIKDCGTKHFVNFIVSSERKLKQIIGRHYYVIDDQGRKVSDELHTVTPESTDLVGKHIGLRSPVCCCGKHVCATCYGRELSEINKDINTGLAATLKLTEPLTQRLLSAKHCVTCC